MAEQPKPGDSFEVWCGLSANLLSAGQITEYDGKTLKGVDDWCGRPRRVVLPVEAPGLTKSEHAEGWFGLLDPGREDEIVYPGDNSP